MALDDNKQKVKQAIALEYNPEDYAPRVIATGQGKIAEKILDIAKEENVPVHKDEKLAKTLSMLDVGEAIPAELYEVVAEILVFVDAMDKIKAKLNN